METQAQVEQLTAQEAFPTGQPEPVLPDPAPNVKPRARWRRFFGWFWCSTEFSRTRSVLAAESAARRRFRTRARMATDFAERASEPQLSNGATNTDAVACELYRQSLYWAILAIKAPEVEDARPELRALLDAPDVRALLGDGPALELLETEDLTDLSGRPAQEQSRLLFTLREAAERALLLLEAPQHELSVLWLKRLVRSSIILIVLALCVVMAFAVRDLREQNADLALNKPWRASSNAVTGCGSPLQFCDDSPSYFFHTADEKDPWVEIDLEEAKDFSAVRLIARRDCCFERGLPLVVEVSLDQTKWKQVAKRTETYKSLKLEFPRQHARYVRVRAVGVTMLHLAAVRVLP
jgi:hypothetical protein